MPTVYTLPTSYMDGVDSVTASIANNLGTAVNEISARRPVYWPRHVPLAYYATTDNLEGTSSGTALVINQLYGAWFQVPEPNVTYDRIDLSVQTAGAASTFARLMVYADDGAGSKPGTLLLDAGTVLVDSTGTKAITINFIPPNGGIWLAVVSSGTPSLWSAGGDRIKPLGAENGTTPYRTWSFANGSTTAPNPFPSGAALSTSIFTPHLRLRRA